MKINCEFHKIINLITSISLNFYNNKYVALDMI